MVLSCHVARITVCGLTLAQECADSEAGLRPKLVDAFRKRWFSASNSMDVKAAAADFAAVVSATVGNDAITLPLPHDAVLCRILRAILVADVINAPSADVKKLLADVEPARQVCVGACSYHSNSFDPNAGTAQMSWLTSVATIDQHLRLSKHRNDIR